MEGEYAGEELRIEVRTFSLNNRSGSRPAHANWSCSCWRLRSNGLLRVPSWMTYRSRWTHPSPTSTLQCWTISQNLCPRHTFRVDPRRPPRCHRRNFRRTARPRARVPHYRRFRDRICRGDRNRARLLNPDETNRCHLPF